MPGVKPPPPHEFIVLNIVSIFLQRGVSESRLGPVVVLLGVGESLSFGQPNVSPDAMVTTHRGMIPSSSSVSMSSWLTSVLPHIRRRP